MNKIAVILTDARARVLWVNQDFESMTGYSALEMVGQSPGRILQGPRTSPDDVRMIREGLASGGPFKAQVLNYKKNGDEYLCKLVVHPIFNPEKELVNYLAFEVDGNKVKDETRIPLMSIDPRYRTSSLRGVEEVRLFNRIKEVMKEDRPYLNANLTLRKFADRLDTNTKYLSQVINHQGKSNFLTFINGYRIAAVRERLDRGLGMNQTYFGVAQECGFKNKSTFYKVFRDTLGLTPHKYVEKIERDRMGSQAPKSD